MRDLLELLAVFAGIYLFDCVHWARRGSTAFRAWWWKRVRAVPDDALPGNERYGIVFAQPFPPFGRLFLTEVFPLSLTRDSAVSFVSAAANPGLRPRQVERVLPLDAPMRVTVEARRVLVDGELFVEAGSAPLARRTAEFLIELARLEPNQREPRLDAWLRASLDARAAAERVEAFERVSPSVRLACAAQLTLVFVVTPLIAFRWGLALTWIPLLGALIVLQAFITWSFVRAHRALHVRGVPGGRAEAVLIALSPPAAMRAFDALSRDLLSGFHPLAAAAALLPREEFTSLVESTLRDALHPLRLVRESQNETMRTVAESWRERNVAALEAFASANGLAGKAWRAAPVRSDVECVAWCPRCARQFTRPGGGCERCLDMPLKSFGTT